VSSLKEAVVDSGLMQIAGDADPDVTRLASQREGHVWFGFGAKVDRAVTGDGVGKFRIALASATEQRVTSTGVMISSVVAECLVWLLVVPNPYR
jgi:hypothetical protein